jgi:CRP-like cAMP-binding protein
MVDAFMLEDLQDSKPAALHSAPFALHQWRQNRLLGLLPEPAWQRLKPRLELVALPLGATLLEEGMPMHSAYFPTTGIVSLLCGNPDGSCTEIAAVGQEGMVGVSLLMGGNGGLGRAIVRGEGHAYRIDAQALRQEFDHGEAAARLLLLRYAQTLMAQIAQTAVCNRHHSLDQQLCRWLLGTLDRSSRTHLMLTHELIAGALGVRREGVTQAAGRLRRLGFIACSRGRIEVIDRQGLESQVCECYTAVRDQAERLFPRLGGLAA